METVPAPTAQDDSSGANPSSVKSDDSSPHHESGRGSPPPNCAICLGTCRNKSFTDSCLHQFCFKCLLTWSKVKAECPLCKQNFRSIIHNVRSNHQYEEYMVEQRHTEETTERIDIDNLTTTTRRFRYRTTLTLPRSDSIAIQQLLLHYPLMTDVFPPPAAPARRRRSPASFRRTVYRHNLWARPLPDFTGRFRACSPEFYRYNDSQMHRLIPWLNRELSYLLNENVGRISYIITKILQLLPHYHINSIEFREAMQRYFGDRTEHFLHELYCFASTPYDMTGYDRNVQYTTDTRISTMVNEVISSSESDASVDSDIVMVSSSRPAEPPPGPSRVAAPVYPQNYIPEPTTTNNNVIPIETLSQSDTDDDSSEVMVVGYIKPPQDRTPEVVDLLGSDSDVIVQDNILPEPSQNIDSQEDRTAPLVMLSLKRHKTPDGDSDSEDSTYTPPPMKRKKRYRLNASSTTTDTCLTTPSPDPNWESESNSSSSKSVHTSPTSTMSSSTNDSSDVSYRLSNKRKRIHKKKPKRKNKDSVHGERSKRKTKKQSSRPHHKVKKRSEMANESEKLNKRKSSSGKGVKSSKKKDSLTATPKSTIDVSLATNQPSTSGISSKKDKVERGLHDSRLERESKRLKSIVNVINYQKNSSDSNSSSNIQNTNDSTAFCINSENVSESLSVGDIYNKSEEVGTEITVRKEQNCSNTLVATRERTTRDLNDNITDSEDDLPLNLTVIKANRHST